MYIQNHYLYILRNVCIAASMMYLIYCLQANSLSTHEESIKTSSGVVGKSCLSLIVANLVLFLMAQETRCRGRLLQWWERQMI